MRSLILNSTSFFVVEPPHQRQKDVAQLNEHGNGAAGEAGNGVVEHGLLGGPVEHQHGQRRVNSGKIFPSVSQLRARAGGHEAQV